LPNGALQELENSMQVAKFGVGESVVGKVLNIMIFFCYLDRRPTRTPLLILSSPFCFFNMCVNPEISLLDFAVSKQGERAPGIFFVVNGALQVLA